MNNFKKRFLASFLPLPERRTIALVTGARQTGKTTLAKVNYPHLPYFNLDALEIRDKLQLVNASEWGRSVGNAIIDEAQKLPQVFEKIKYAYDASSINFSVLLGSSQITLLKNIRESLAGRVSIYELYPFLLAEIYTAYDEALQLPLLDTILRTETLEALAAQPALLLNEEADKRKQAQAYLLKWGGMPELLSLTDPERQKWIKDYEYTYLERDLSDLARLNDLQPFRTFQALAAARTGCLLNYSELARDASVSVDSTRRYLEYLKLSYQVILLQPYFKNLSSTLVKTPKIYWLDIGILRYLLGLSGAGTGEIFETMVVSELYKYIKTLQHQAELYFYRTRSGLELDIIIQLPHGIIGVEIKSRNQVYPKDVSSLKEIQKHAKKDWLGGLLIYNGEEIKQLGSQLWAVPSWRLF
jgi:hypothetical protein